MELTAEVVCNLAHGARIPSWVQLELRNASAMGENTSNIHVYNSVVAAGHCANILLNLMDRHNLLLLMQKGELKQL